MEQVMVQLQAWLAQLVVWMPWLGDEQGALLAVALLVAVTVAVVAVALVARRRRSRRIVPAAPDTTALPEIRQPTTPLPSRPAEAPLPAPAREEAQPEAAAAPPAAPVEPRPVPEPVAPPAGLAPAPVERPSEAPAPALQPLPPEAIPAAKERLETPEAPEPTAEAVVPRIGWLGRIRAGLSKTRAGLVDGLGSLFLGGKRLDDDLLEDLETRLLMADVGLDATRRILDGLTKRLGRKDLVTPELVRTALAEDMTALLAPCEQPLQIAADAKPFVILVVGINGAGKTTTIGKLAKRLKAEGRKVMLAAGDTFRAAAVEQLQTWGARNDVPVVAQHTGADSASVIYDAVAAGQARGADVVIADTAGRLHTQSNLMQELAKIKRVLAKLDPHAPHEVLLVVDGGTGQNALNQAQQFHQAIGLTGVAITKLDGTAKGGMLFAIAQKLGVPIRFIGVGEGIEDLQPFVARDFVGALLGLEQTGGSD
ncbi:MAG TPA: signal recognition particle-docking protein FtsY [Candidatus Acidoferrales bacterium]|nr:signal recognition particle-docking protein FtsY [Candidatus Acidoferrales bacterium]